MEEKQIKVSNKIRHTNNCGQTTPLGTKPNDECYTSMKDIIQELAPWGDLDKFRGKNIICPCDWDIVDGEEIYSITITYNDCGVTVEGNAVNKMTVQYDLWDEDNNITVIKLKEEEIDDFLSNKLTCNFVRTLTQNARRWGIKSITASGYNPANGKGVRFQDVDYSKYDVCITNPPFSLYNEFMSNLIKNKINFIVLAPFLNRVAISVGLPLMLKQAYIGWNNGDVTNMQFYNPTSTNQYKTKKVACDWIVSYSEAQEERNKMHYRTHIKYDLYKEEYSIMDGMTMRDGTHPIRVPAAAFPDDYDGWMFTSIQILNHLDDTYEWYGTNYMKYYNSTAPDKNPFNHKTSNEMVKTNGKQMFHGIVFRKKPKVENN